MSLSYCESCQALEGDTRETDDGVVECEACGDEVTRVPEHDDGDER